MTVQGPEFRGAAPGKTLGDITANWFLFLVTFRRNVKTMPSDVTWVQETLLSQLAEMEGKAQAAHLEFQFQDAKYPLVYLADEILLNCRWDGEAAWAKDLLEARVFQTQHGGQDFFTRLSSPSLQDTQVLEIYYECLCLGFRGMHIMQPLKIREEKDRVYRRLSHSHISGPRFCPEAYEHTIERSHVKHPVMATAMIGSLAAVFMLVIYLVATQIFDFRISDLTSLAEKLANPQGTQETKTQGK